MDKIVSLAKLEINSLRGQKRIFSIATNIVFPAIFAFWLVFEQDVSKTSQWLFWIPLLLLILLHIGIAYFNISGTQLVQEAYFEARDISEKNRKLKRQNAEFRKQILYLSILQDTVIAWRVMQRKYKEAAFDNKEDFDNAVSEILSIIVNKRDEIFGFSSSELWNFAVYIFHPNESKLKPVWRRKHDNHPSGDLGRVWGLGQGHIGKAFSNRETIITSDATDPEVAALMGPTQSMVREYDDTVYRSFASVVIGPIDSDAAPIGVFVATSDQEGRFDRANALLLRHAAAELANLIHINEIAPETMLD